MRTWFPLLKIPPEESDISLNLEVGSKAWFLELTMPAPVSFLLRVLKFRILAIGGTVRKSQDEEAAPEFALIVKWSGSKHGGFMWR